MNLSALIEAKRALLPAGCNAFRVLDGTAPYTNIFIDALADRLLVSLRDRSIPAALLKQLEQCGKAVFVKQLDKDDKRPPQQIAGPKLPLRFEIMEHHLRYMMDMNAGYSQGIFLDQRNNRAEIIRRSQEKPGMKLLNTFAYTGAFSLCAASVGAETTTLDLARPCLDWGKENMQLNGIDPENQFFCKGDALHWMGRFARQGRKFDGIVLDPPTFSRDEKGKIWRVESNYDSLVALAADILAPGGFILCSTNCRKLYRDQFERMVSDGAPHLSLQWSKMPADFDGEPYLKCIWAQG